MGPRPYFAALAFAALTALAPASWGEGAGRGAGAEAGGGGGAARTDGLTEDEASRLAHGETVMREQTLERGAARYVGGVTYTLIDATPEEMSTLLDEVSTYKRVLPRTKDARLVGQNDGDSFIELHQGNALVDAAYTLRIRKDEAAHEARFWLDPTHPHDIADAWGFFRYEPVVDAAGTTRVLLTYGVLVDLGPGLVRDLFEERVRMAMLGVPQLVRGYVAQNVRARAGL
jgi:hypothetical protein